MILDNKQWTGEDFSESVWVLASNDSNINLTTLKRYPPLTIPNNHTMLSMSSQVRITGTNPVPSFASMSGQYPGSSAKITVFSLHMPYGIYNVKPFSIDTLYLLKY